jgi:hypothetical protein
MEEPRTAGATGHDVSVDHGWTEVRVTKLFLDRADVIHVFQGVLKFVEWPLCERGVLRAELRRAVQLPDALLAFSFRTCRTCRTCRQFGHSKHRLPRLLGGDSGLGHSH